MRKQTHFFNGSAFWILCAVIGFFCLPSMALYYGIMESTSDELYAAMGWSGFNLS